MSENKIETSNVRAQTEVGAFWEKDQYANLRFFGRMDVEQLEILIKKAKKNKSSKINLVGYKCRKTDGKNGPDYILVESKFNDHKSIGRGDNE